jgi:hypothetical protein
MTHHPSPLSPFLWPVDPPTAPSKYITGVSTGADDLFLVSYKRPHYPAARARARFFCTH